MIAQNTKKIILNQNYFQNLHLFLLNDDTF